MQPRKWGEKRENTKKWKGTKYVFLKISKIQEQNPDNINNKICFSEMLAENLWQRKFKNNIERKGKITADLTDFKRKKRIRNNDNTL